VSKDLIHCVQQVFNGLSYISTKHHNGNNGISQWKVNGGDMKVSNRDSVLSCDTVSLHFTSCILTSVRSARTLNYGHLNSEFPKVCHMRGIPRRMGLITNPIRSMRGVELKTSDPNSSVVYIETAFQMKRAHHTKWPIGV